MPEGKRKVTLYLSEDTYRHLKVMAAEIDRDMSDIADTVLRVALDQMEKESEKR